jgi:hypothetical protein
VTAHLLPQHDLLRGQPPLSDLGFHCVSVDQPDESPEPVTSAGTFRAFGGNELLTGTKQFAATKTLTATEPLTATKSVAPSTTAAGTRPFALSAGFAGMAAFEGDSGPGESSGR